MTTLDRLKAASSLEDFASILDYTATGLSYILYKGPTSGRYTVFDIPKRSGGTRKIHAPDERLKGLQKKLTSILEECHEEIVQQRGFRHTFSHGFECNRSIITNAWMHKKRRFVLNLDLENFFPSINFGRVRGYFIKNREFSLHPNVATIIAQISCFENYLPQGAPSSPIISNFIAHVLDIRLGKLAAAGKCTYSRYADDLTISSNKKEFPSSIAVAMAEHPSIWILSDKLQNEITRCGFTIAPSKTRMQCRPSKQVVTGLSVNEKVNVQAIYYRSARAMCDSLFKRGEFYRGARSSKTLLPTTSPEMDKDTSYLEGVMAHIYHVKHTSDLRSGRLDSKKEAEDIKRARYPAYRELYKKLLYYKHFVALEKPLIVCEGKTDNIYLRSALKALAKKYPSLAKEEAGALVTNIKFLRHSRIEHDILELSGGSSNLAHLIGRYEKSIKNYRFRPLDHPVIILIDNDSGSKPIFSAINKKIKKQLGLLDKSPFYHVCFNLYLIKTPEMGLEGTSCIENLFSENVLNTKLNGKSFSLEKEYDLKTHYGKMDFADKVVRPNSSKIDFGRFESLFDRIVAAIDDYSSRKGHDDFY